MAACIQEEPSALWVQVLKGIYFPNYDFFEAQKGGRASWGWSSLIVGRDVLKQDGLWTLGTGRRIRIYTDPWLPQKSGFRAERIQPGTHELSVESEPGTEPYVSDLIGPKGKWDEPKVHNLVSCRDAEMILTLLIPYDHMEYKYVWP